MKTQSEDTHPDIERMLIEHYRTLTPAQRMQRVWDMNRFVAQMAMADVKRRHPNADEYECRLRVASRRVPADLMRKAFGWDPEEKGY